MNVSLTSELEAHVHAFVEKGLYGNQSEVIRAGLRLLLEREEERNAKLQSLREDVRLGIQDALDGKGQQMSLDEFIRMAKGSKNVSGQ